MNSEPFYRYIRKTSSPTVSVISCINEKRANFFKFLFIYDSHREREREREREAETQAKGEGGSLQGSGCGTRSQIPGSRPGPKAGAKPLRHPGIPVSSFNNHKIIEN